MPTPHMGRTQGMPVMDNSVVKSVGRVFEVLELFDHECRALTATQVGRKLKYPASSTLALLKSMVNLGYIGFDRAERVYAPTVRVSNLGRWVETSLFGEGRLFGMMEDLRAKTGQSLMLSIQNDLNMQFIHVVLGESFSLNVKAGQTVPLFRSAIGLMALSDRPDKEIAKFVERYNRRIKGPEQKVELNQLMSAIRRARTQGYATGYDLYYPGVGAIAFLLKPKVGRYSAVLSISGVTAKLKEAEAQIVRTAKAGIRSINADTLGPG
ncbi:MAG: helix-turn-helix domain-containing protein [Alphaproteobacteria bacterium]|nr:helix-turn-helix domain-containing protein [Alphaproteobacteria bacterium]